MDRWIAELLSDGLPASPLLTPIAFGLLLGLAVLLMWSAFAPAAPARLVGTRLQGYVEQQRTLDDGQMARPFATRAVLPLLRQGLRLLGGLLPQKGIERTRQLLVQAGSPGGLSALDFYGVTMLLMLGLAGGYYALLGRGQPLLLGVRNALMLAMFGYLLPRMWLRRSARQRQHRIQRALPDALDMLTIGVEAGLAFESALLRVCDQWDNPLTHELRRAVAEMRMGTAREAALQALADRTGVQDLSTFVAVLVQSSQLGVSIAQVLHTQAEQMRDKRRQRAEELARSATIKLIFPLVFLEFPALFVIILGPALPGLIGLLSDLGG
ncbi:MAG: type II secretion system F family protein [Anaerolineae bacterium]